MSACRRSRRRPTRSRARSASCDGYWCYWHGAKGYSGVALHVRKDARAGAADVRASRLRLRDAASSTCAWRAIAGRVDLRAERRQGLRRQDALPRGAGRVRRRRCARPATALVLCGDLNVARTEHGRPPEGAQADADRPAPRGARAARAHPRARPRRRRPRARSRQRRPVHLVGAVAQHAPAQHRLAPRLRARERARSPRGRRAACRCANSAPATTRRWSRPSATQAHPRCRHDHRLRLRRHADARRRHDVHLGQVPALRLAREAAAADLRGPPGRPSR